MRPKQLAAVTAMALMLSGAVAYADPPWAREENDHGGEAREHSRHEKSSVKIVIEEEDRGHIRDYIADHYREHCPPGLAKKHNGCKPPGLSRHYAIGRPLASTIVYEEVPEELLMRLEPVPVGYRYVMVDRDVLLISEASKKVIDAVTLLSAVGR